MKRLPWVKLHDDLFTSPSHADLDGDALLVLVVLMTFVRASCDASGEWTPWALLPSGKPVSVAALATKARKPPDVAAAAVRALVDAGTVEVREDGAIGLPGFRRHQEGDSTPRAAASRARRRVEPAAPTEAPRATEVRPAPPRPVLVAAPPGLSTLPGTEAAVERSRQIAYLGEKLAYGWNDHPPPQPRGLPRLRLHLKGVEPLLASGVTPDELLAAIDAVAELVEVGELPPTDWTSTKVFSGWLDPMRVRHAEWTRKREERRLASLPTPEEPSAPAMDGEEMAALAAAQLRKLRGDA